MAEQTHQQAVESRPDLAGALWRFAEMVGGALFSPSRTMREIGQREAILPAFFLVFLVVGVNAAGQLASLLTRLLDQDGAGTGVLGDAAGSMIAFEVTGILWNIVWGPVLWTITAGLLYGIAYLLGGRGRFMALWAASGFALVPQLLAAPLAPLTEATGVIGPGWQLLAIMAAIPIYFTTFFWTLALLAVAVAQTMNLSGGRAFGSVALLIGGLILLVILLICAFFAIVVGIIAVAAS